MRLQHLRGRSGRHPVQAVQAHVLLRCLCGADVQLPQRPHVPSLPCSCDSQLPPGEGVSVTGSAEERAGLPQPASCCRADALAESM